MALDYLDSHDFLNERERGRFMRGQRRRLSVRRQLLLIHLFRLTDC